MDNKEFAALLEKRTRKFAVQIIYLLLLALITVRQIVPEVKRILKTKSSFVQAKQVKRNIGLK